jgi:alkanesulfonate monooxygenase SsuD/methylene tetrahydromethanopterin reductase-like flavin-dependent oxidoreductase (luciferase family)
MDTSPAGGAAAAPGPAALSIGIAASLGPGLGSRVAAMAEDAGFSGLWVNDTPGADALSVLEACARATTGIRLATGVLPVDRRPADEVVARVAASRLPQERLVLGIGSGQLRSGALDRVRDAATLLRDDLDASVMIGALGPRMRRLAARAADGPLLSWLTPSVAAEQARAARAVASGTRVVLYVRTALDPAATARLREETDRYAGYPAYAANFARLGIDAVDTVIDGAKPSSAERLADYRQTVDEVVLRAITADDTIEDYRRLLRSAHDLASLVP